MTCPDVGELRALLDDAPEASTPQVSAHLAGCARCTAELARLRQDAELATPAVALLRSPEVPADTAVEAALERVAARHRASARPVPTPAAPEPPPPTADVASAVAPRRRRLPARLRVAASAAAALLTMVLIVVTPTGQSLAAQFLAQFRGERFEVVETDPSQGWQALNALGSLGQVDGTLTGLEPVRVGSVEEGSQRVGFPVREPGRLPAGVGATPEVSVADAQQVRFTFDGARVRDYLAAQGQAGTQVPAGLDGTSLVVQVPAAVLFTYPGEGGGPGLLVGQADVLEATTEGGMSLEQLRAFLLDLPGLPSETVEQLRGIQDWERTLPLPLPAGAGWQETTVAGAPGLTLEQAGLGSAAVWQRDGRVYGLAGRVEAAELLQIAETLR